jgi:uncharacterized protein YceK
MILIEPAKEEAPMRTTLIAKFALATATVWTVPVAVCAQTLFSFQPNSAHAPVAGLTPDGHGGFYGTTYEGGAGNANNGTVYALKPPSPGQTAWTQTVLYSFQAKPDGALPSGPLFRATTGVLYGTTSQGGAVTTGECNPAGCGTFFSLTPPSPGQTAWTEQILHSFDGNDGYNVGGKLTSDQNRGFYLPTTQGGSANCFSGCGNVLHLSAPHAGQTQWASKILYQFDGGASGYSPGTNLARDSNGVLYGTTSSLYNSGQDFGSVFKLVPPAAGQSAWTLTTIYNFAGGTDGSLALTGVMLGANGALYGTTAGPATDLDGICSGLCGTAFMLSPPLAGQVLWSKTTLYVFAGSPDGTQPSSALIMDAAGNLYGATGYGGLRSKAAGVPVGCGTVFELSPPAPGQPTWTELSASSAACAYGQEPAGDLVFGTDGAVYGVTVEGGAAHVGTVFRASHSAH